jgi:hypothetical protein
MSDAKVTDELAAHVMGWKPGPDRFTKSGRNWIPRWRFQPLTDLPDAFQVLDRAADHYTLTRDGRTFTAEVRSGSGRGTASGELLAKTIALAVARAIGLYPTEGTTRASITAVPQSKDEVRKR